MFDLDRCPSGLHLTLHRHRAVIHSLRFVCISLYGLFSFRSPWWQEVMWCRCHLAWYQTAQSSPMGPYFLHLLYNLHVLVLTFSLQLFCPHGMYWLIWEKTLLCVDYNVKFLIQACIKDIFSLQQITTVKTTPSHGSRPALDCTLPPTRIFQKSQP